MTDPTFRFIGGLVGAAALGLSLGQLLDETEPAVLFVVLLTTAAVSIVAFNFFELRSRHRDAAQTLAGGSPFEPDILRLGNAFELDFRHATVQAVGAGAAPQVPVVKGSGRARWSGGRWEHPTTSRRGRRGFMDLVITVEDPDTELPAKVVVEVKNTDWDEIKNIRRTLSSHRIQIWSYLEPLVDLADNGELGFLQGWVVYPARPKTVGLADRIEDAFAEYGVSVLWYRDLPVEPS